MENGASLESLERHPRPAAPPSTREPGDGTQSVTRQRLPGLDGTFHENEPWPARARPIAAPFLAFETKPPPLPFE